MVTTFVVRVDRIVEDGILHQDRGILRPRRADAKRHRRSMGVEEPMPAAT